MMEHEPQRDARAFGNSRRSGPQVALAEEVEQGVDHGAAGASRAGKASVEDGKMWLQVPNLLH